MGAILSIFSEIGQWTIIAEGSVVKMKQSIPARVVAVGNPAKIVRDLSEKDRAFRTWGNQIHVDLAEKYLDIGMQPLPD
jgi:carbonic anhydrase/acetyltransferase-like protein (isoleucine patch superfamily)